MGAGDVNVNRKAHSNVEIVASGLIIRAAARETHMLYKLKSSFDALEPVAFVDFTGMALLEKQLENLIADNILGVLYEDARLMPVFQERALQPEADIYALNELGDLVIFELKRGAAADDALNQGLRYTQDAGQWSFEQLEQRYRQYTGDHMVDLSCAHKDLFDLNTPLDTKAFNSRQHLIVIGSAADESLMAGVDYWRRQGLSVEFLPYRAYKFGGEHYFEFFALPYDKHTNPAEAKGVLFDTNRTNDEDSLWFMMEKRCVAAFGDAKRFVDYVHPGDTVFFSHVGVGIVAAARVLNNPVRSPDTETRCRDVEFLTPVPRPDGDLNAMPFRTVSEVVGHGFFWARAIKVPYLSPEETEKLVNQLRHYLDVGG